MKTAELTINASTYDEAIKKVGDEMDTLWGNGNWTLVSACARRISTAADYTVGWEWDFRIEWKGLRPS